MERLQLRNPAISKLSFDALIKKRVNDEVFKLRDGTTTENLGATFRHLMRDIKHEVSKGVSELSELRLVNARYLKFADAIVDLCKASHVLTRKVHAG